MYLNIGSDHLADEDINEVFSISPITTPLNGMSLGHKTTTRWA
jgi:hypothetical protein